MALGADCGQKIKRKMLAGFQRANCSFLVRTKLYGNFQGYISLVFPHCSNMSNM